MSGAPFPWLRVLRRYLGGMALGNLLWEFAHMPLYTLWQNGTAAEIVFAALHCTGGDLLIALSALTAALLLVGTERWPDQGFLPVALAATAIGLGYTLFSEWLNVEVRQSWGYSRWMPVLPWIGTGLSPLLQWMVLPFLGFSWVRWETRR